MKTTSLNRGADGKGKGVPDIKRICALCGVDRTPLVGGIYPVNDRRGACLGLFGECCYRAVLQAVDESPRAYRWYGNLTTEQIHTKILTRAKEIGKVSV